MRDALGAIQSVLLLGGGSEIGLAIVKEVAKTGRLKRVVLAVRSDHAEQLGREALANNIGLRIDVVRFDAAQSETLAPCIDAAFADGPIDCVISAFGVLGNDIDQINDVDGVAKVLDINYRSAVLSGTLVVQKLQHQGYGSFVVLSSVAAERSRADNFVYASTKAGIDAWANGLADALHGTGVDVTVVRPGFVHTKMTQGVAVAPLATTPDVVGDVVAEAIQRRQTLVWAPRTVRPLMSTLRHLPRPVFRAVVKKSRAD